MQPRPALLPLLAAALLLAPLPGRAQPAAATAEVEATHQQLRALKGRMQEALNTRDLAALLEDVTEDVVFTTMNGDRAVGKAAIRAYFEKMLSGPDAVVESAVTAFEADALSHLYGEETAVAFGSSKDRYLLRGGAAFEVAPRWTATMVRRDGRWLVASFHYSVDMFDNPVLAAQRRTLLLGGAGLAAILTLVGFLLGRRAGRRAARP